ncbi:MAG: MerR family transcriptional regulator [Acidibacillus sp.]|uniref:HTH-type transcriptional regulator YfmP n=1 Tax=Sulfoacidibacillus ferrooxidans TaxID=2005001 RepID=A0A9X2AE28_9BACL|nr:MerR family transcriptional regulator [Sulfoacidibacillus ferrooxidans]MCI0182892.1 HTH-type transcriptional regulator YfmP [Sulfoacidibacillus ferrooxidans]MCY0893535.1 MerR family transcriptional regulator [Acidibacillus sp.]
MMQEVIVTDDSTLFSVEDVVKKCGVTARTLHYYEEVGLITPSCRTSGGHRLYDKDVVEKLSYILRIKDNLGYSLQEIRNVLQAQEALDRLRVSYQSGSEDERQQIVDESIDLMMEVMNQIDGKMNKLEEMKKNLLERLEHVKTLRR